MRRLVETNLPPGSPERELAQAVAAVARVRATPARQQRILAGVTARARRRRWSALGLLLRPAIAGAILLVAGVAGAAATVGHAWVAREWHQLTSKPPVAVAARPRPVAIAPAPRVARPAPVDPVVSVEPAVPAPRPVAARVASRARAPRGEDPTALVAAVRALRSEHDPARAARLVNAYLRAYPRGALAEEALALEIEAAAALKRPQAAGFAQQYLRLYPNGRFQAVARQALDARF